MKQALSVLAPPPILKISQWADRERVLSSEAAAEPGRWRTSRAEYARGIMDAVTDADVTRVVCMKSTQVGWTELLMNTLGYFICEDPCPILLIQPTVEAGEAWSKERLAPMIRDTPAITARVGDVKSRDSGNTIRGKTFPGGLLAIVGANAPTGLASRPIRIVLADEVDKYPVSAGTEGNPLALAAKRQGTFWNRKTLIGSTPTIKGASEIESEWLNSDQRHFWVPCPDCQTAQVLKWSNVVWDKPAGEHLAHTAHYTCEGCGTLWDDVTRGEAVKRGEWRSERPFNGVAGFHVNAMMSPWVQLHEIVDEFLRSRHDPERLKTWVNTTLGETWEEKAETVDATSFIGRRESYGPRSVPEAVRLVTAGVDVQGDRLEMIVVGWCAHEETYAIAYHVIPGDPSQGDVWDILDDLLLSAYQSEDGRELRIRAVAIDTGGFYANEVLNFCKVRLRRRVFAIKGAPGPRPIWPKWASRTKHNDQIFLIGVDTAKDTLYGRLRITAPGEEKPYVHFPVSDDFDQRFFDQLTSEQVVTRYREGRPYRVWVLPSGRRNEALDAFVYALAARMALPVKLDRPLSAGRAPGRTPTGPVVIQPAAAAASAAKPPPAKRSLVSMLAR